MNLVKTEPFEFDKKQYEIRIFSDGWEFAIQAYINDKPANGYTYSVKLPTAFDLKKAWGLDAVQELVKTAKSDIENRNWERYVEAYLSNLRKTEERVIFCPKCQGKSIFSEIVDERKMFECKNCNNIWYKKRKITNGYLSVVDGITDEISQKGYCEIDAEILLNTAFRENSKESLSFNNKIKNWANLNKLRYQTLKRRDASGNVNTIFRFER